MNAVKNAMSLKRATKNLLKMMIRLRLEITFRGTQRSDFISLSLTFYTSSFINCGMANFISIKLVNNFWKSRSLLKSLRLIIFTRKCFVKFFG